MSMRHALASLLALRAREFSEFYARTSFVLSSCVPRGPTTPTKQGKVGIVGAEMMVEARHREKSTQEAQARSPALSRA